MVQCSFHVDNNSLSLTISMDSFSVLTRMLVLVYFESDGNLQFVLSLEINGLFLLVKTY
jgi:hypothetical protein